MEQSWRRPSSPEDSNARDGGSASNINLVYPSPVLLSSVSPELGNLPTANAHPVSGFNDEPPDLASSSGSDCDDYETHRLEQERAAAASRSAACAAAVRARRNIRRRLDVETDDDLETTPSASRQRSQAKVYGSDDFCPSQSNKRTPDVFGSDAYETESDEAEGTNTSQASSVRSRVIKTAWRVIKEYDRSKMEDATINEDIDQIMRDSLRDANFHAENVELKRETDRGYFKQAHVSPFTSACSFNYFASNVF